MAPVRSPHGLRAPAPPGRGAVPARPRPRRSASAPTPPSASASRARSRPTSSAYGGWLAALIIAATSWSALTAPYADPVLLPVVAALNGLGLAVIHRLDLAYEAAERRRTTSPSSS